MRDLLAEAEGWAFAGPRERNPAAVAADDLGVGTEEGRVLTILGINLDDLVQAEFLALVQVGRTGESKHE